jgi:hypothetical protein
MNSPHIELEQLDDKMNWFEMKKLLNSRYREYLLLHLHLTKNIFHWKIYDLPIEQQDYILN